MDTRRICERPCWNCRSLVSSRYDGGAGGRAYVIQGVEAGRFWSCLWQYREGERADGSVDDIHQCRTSSQAVATYLAEVGS